MSRGPKSRFRSLAGKKIEKQVRKDVAMFRPYVNNRRGHDVASGANRRGKPIMDSNIGHASNILSGEKSASSAMNASKTNKRDDDANDANRRDNVASSLVGQTPIMDSNVRHGDGVPYLVSQPDRRNPLKDENIKHNNTSAIHASLSTLLRAENKRSVAFEANRQANHTSRPIKQDPLRKNTNTKRVEAIMPNENWNRRTKNFDDLVGYNDALPSRLKRQVSLDNGGRLIVHKHSDRDLTIKAIEEASPKQMKKQGNKEVEGDDAIDKNPVGEINGDAYPWVKDYIERNLNCCPMERQRGNTKTNEDEAIDNSGMKLMEVEDGDTQLETHDHSPKNKKKRGIESNEGGDGKADDSFSKINLESLPQDHVSLDCSNEAIQPEKLTRRKLKKWRQDIMRNDGEELHVGGDRSPLVADDDSSRLTLQAPISIDCLAELPPPFVFEHVKQQCNYCSKPIDKPIWSGIFKIDGQEYISLAGHLSTKSCDKVWELSRSLVPVVEVTKLSRSKFKIWETSKPSCDSIGLYFFPNNMRHDEDLAKLVKEVIEDDLVLQTVIGEVEMLIFASTLLPERYRTFQRKHYLWGVFRPRQDQRATIAEPVHDAVCCAQEKEKEEEHASDQQVHLKSPAKIMQQAAATRGVPGSPDMGFQPEAPEERQLGDALRHTLHSAEATAVASGPAAVTTEAAALATNAATRPSEATENDTNASTIPRNHGRSDSIAGVPPGRFFCFVAGQTPKLEQLIQEMQREDSLVFAVRGEAIGAGLWPGNIVPTNISRASAAPPVTADQPNGSA